MISGQIFAGLKHLISRLGLNSLSLLTKYAAASFGGVITVFLLIEIGQGMTLVGGILTALLFFVFTQIRDTYLEARLKSSLETAISGLSATFEDLHIIIRNTTSVPITIREIRLSSSSLKGYVGSIIRLRFICPSYHVVKNDPDEMKGDFFPHKVDFPWIVKAEMGQLGEGNSLTSYPEPGDFHIVPPEAGATYALSYMVSKQYLENDIADILMIVEYPSLLGRPKVTVIHATKGQLVFVQRYLREQMPRMEQQANEILARYRQTVKKISHNFGRVRFDSG